MLGYIYTCICLYIHIFIRLYTNKPNTVFNNLSNFKAFKMMNDAIFLETKFVSTFNS